MVFPSGGKNPEATRGQGRIPAMSFATADLPRATRFSAWQRMVAPLFEVQPLKRRRSAGFSASLNVYHFGSFLLCHSRADAARYRRSATHSRLDDLDHYLIHLPLQQAGILGGLRAGGLHAGGRLRPMDVGIFDLAQPAGYLAGAGEAISLVVPRVALAALVRDPNRQHGRVLRRETALAVMLARHMMALAAEATHFAPAEGTALANAGIGLLATCLGFAPAEGGAAALLPPAPARETLARRIRLHIEQNLHRETLTPDSIGRELLVSRSQLYRQFERFGGVHHYVRQRRLRQCLLAICNPLHAGQRIADIAYERGFTDEAHFSRLFRAAFGLSPRAARRAAERGEDVVLAALVPAPIPAGQEGGQEGGQAPFAQWIRELSMA